MYHFSRLLSSASSAIAALFVIVSFGFAFAQTAPTLGTAQNFAVLGASAVTNTGSSIITGDLGVSPGTAITGFPPGIVNGTIHAADAVAAQAQSDANTAYNSLAGQPCNTILTGQDLGGLTLTPGVYCFASAAQLTGILTLNGQGNPNALFIFKIGSTLVSASNSSVVLVNGGSPCNVFFQVGSSGTLGTGTQFIGNIFALSSMTLNTNTTVSGRVIGLNGAVTLDSNVVSVPTCGAIPVTGFVQVCKVAGAGVPVGTAFTFNVAGTPVTVAAGLAPGGTCSTPLTVPIGNAIVTETVPAGVVLTGVATLPSAALLVSSNLAAGTATVTVTTGVQTIVTFIDAAIPVVPVNGFVQVCKVAGAGIPVGTVFNFNVAGTPVTVAAGPAPGGTCGTPVSAPPGAAVITETIPAGTMLVGVSTLPSAGLLVSSNLGTGTATVTVLSGGQTIVTFIDAIIPVVPTNGFVQVCKVAGSGVAPGTNFTFNVAGTPVTIAAGAAPGGTCATPITVPAGNAVITETIPAGTLVSGIATLPSAALLVSSNLAAGTATVTVTAGGQTIVTFIDAAVPVIPNTGFVQVCKVAGVGVPVGTSFTFNVAGTPVIVTAGPAPLGTCGTPIMVPVGTAIVTETIPAGVVLTGVATLPSAALLVSSNLPAGTATVMVNAGGQTIVTFIDAAIPNVPTNGFVQVCKVAGAGVPVGTSFTFNVAGTPVTVVAGPAPGGTCATPVTVPAGTAVITETIPAGTLVAGVSTLPSAALLVSSNLAAGTATVTVLASGQTIVTFIDAAVPVVPTTGFVQVCKVAGAGVAVGTNFTFNVAGTPITVAAGAAPGGTCATPITVPAGNAVITETIPAGTLVSGIATLPSAALLVSSNLAAGTATVMVNAGGQTIVTFIDAAVPVIPNTGFVQVCKVAGVGVTVGTNFTFNVGGTPVTVAAGPAPLGTCATPITVPVGTAIVTETIPAGVVLTGVATLPSAALLVSTNLPAGTATVTVTTGGQTIVTFIDAAIPIVPANGFVQVCKVAGAGVAVGTSFTFNVAGTPVTVSAGPAPGGTCATPISVPTGTAVVTETIPAGTLLAGVSTLPNAGLLVSSNLATGTATVTVLGNGQTIVTFIDAAIPVVPTTGFLQVCKVAGAGIAVGTNFTFNVGGTLVTVQAGAAPGGVCGIPINVPAGPVVITEAAVAGTGVAGISTLPIGLLVSSDLSARTATVTVAPGGQTIVTFINAVATTGLIQVCKVAGTGVAVGTPYTFTFAGTTITILAGATPGTSCSPALVAPVGPALITEVVPASEGEYQIRYASNLNIGDSVVNLTNTGTLTNPGALTTSGNICANVYTFDASEELVSCCSCLVTPNGLNSLSVKQDLIGNTLTPGVPTSVVIKLIATIPLGLTPNGTGGICNPSSPNVSNLLPSGLKAWGTTLHSLPTTPLTYGTTETPFERADLGLNGMTTVGTTPNGLLVSSNPLLGTAVVTVTPGGQVVVTFTNALGSAELTKLTTFCGFIQANGSGFGICKTCRTGGLGAGQK